MNEQETWSNEQYSLLLREQLHCFMDLLESDKTTIIAPLPEGMWEKNPGSFFHLGMEIFLQFDGACVFEFPKQRRVLNPGEILLVPPGLPHREIAMDRNSRIFGNLVYIIDDSTSIVHIARARRRTESATRPDLPYPVYREILPPTGIYPAITAALAQLPVDNRSEIRALRRHYLAALLLQTQFDLGPVRCCEDMANPEEIAGGKKNYKVEMTLKIIHEHILSPMPSVGELAASVKCSPNHLSALFHAVTGVKIKTYINNFRLDYARKLIETTTYNIAEIAWSCGFQDAAYFAKIFRRRFGVSPAFWRNGNHNRPPTEPPS